MTAILPPTDLAALFSLGGSKVDLPSLTDEELDLARTTTRAVLFYLEARGEFFGLATSRIRQDLETLDGFHRSRQRSST